MARTNATDVKGILDTSLSDPTVTEHINAANHIVDDIADADSSLSAARLEDIEKYVAAHFAAAQDQRAESRSGASRSVSYQGDTGMGLQGTKHGQLALTLDPTGVLANSDKPAAGFNVPDGKDIED